MPASANDLIVSPLRILLQVLSNKALSNTERVKILRYQGLTKAQAQAKLAQMGFIVKSLFQFFILFYLRIKRISLFFIGIC